MSMIDSELVLMSSYCLKTNIYWKNCRFTKINTSNQESKHLLGTHHWESGQATEGGCGGLLNDWLAEVEKQGVDLYAGTLF